MTAVPAPPAAPSATLAAAQQRWRDLLAMNDDIRRIERDLKALKEARAELDVQIRDDLVEMGADSVRVDGRTLYLRTDTFSVHLIDEAATIDALKRSDHADIVRETVNGNTLHALVREFLRDAEPGQEDEAIPEELRDVLGIHQRFTIGIRS